MHSPPQTVTLICHPSIMTILFPDLIFYHSCKNEFKRRRKVAFLAKQALKSYFLPKVPMTTANRVNKLPQITSLFRLHLKDRQ